MKTNVRRQTKRSHKKKKMETIKKPKADLNLVKNNKNKYETPRKRSTLATKMHNAKHITDCYYYLFGSFIKPKPSKSVM